MVVADLREAYIDRTILNKLISKVTKILKTRKSNEWALMCSRPCSSVRKILLPFLMRHRGFIRTDNRKAVLS